MHIVVDYVSLCVHHNLYEKDIVLTVLEEDDLDLLELDELGLVFEILHQELWSLRRWIKASHG
jgi:hypothetical protein